MGRNLLLWSMGGCSRGGWSSLLSTGSCRSLHMELVASAVSFDSELSHSFKYATIELYVMIEFSTPS